ncbi:MAG: hypothetical protein AABX05_01245 [Nanoarchaeota archaeon]
MISYPIGLFERIFGAKKEMKISPDSSIPREVSHSFIGDTPTYLFNDHQWTTDLSSALGLNS